MGNYFERGIEEGFEKGSGEEIEALLKGKQKDSIGDLSEEEARVVINTRSQFIDHQIFGRFMSMENEHPETSLQELGFYLFALFNIEKKQRLLLYSNPRGRMEEVIKHAIEEMDIRMVHGYADDRFNHYSHQLGQTLMHTSEYDHIKTAADNWSKAEQISKEAVEYGYRMGKMQ